MSMSERLRDARLAAGFASAAEACRRFGWSEGTYRHHENGTRGVPAKRAAEYGRAYRVSPEWLLYGRGGPEKKGVPLVGFVGAGAEVRPIDDGGSLDDIDPPPGIGPSAVAVKVTGDSMWPRYSEGDILVFDEHALPDSLANRECVLKLRDGRTFVKVLRKQPDGRWTLESFNAPPLHDVELEWAAKIKWVRRSDS